MKKSKPKKQRKLTIKQRKFIDEVVATGNATEAANRVYNVKNRNVANNIGAENLAKPSIVQGIEERLKLAKDKIFYLSQFAEKEEIQLKASQDVADRVEGKAIQRVVQDTTIKTIDENTPLEELLLIIKK